MTIEEIVPGHLRYEFHLPTRGSVSYLSQKERAVSRALLAIGYAVFDFEKFLKLGRQHKLDIVIERVWWDRSSKRDIEICLERFFSYVLLSEIKIRLIEGPSLHNEHIPQQDMATSDAVCLFSGGVDSVSGLLGQTRRIRNLSAVFCSHIHQSRVVSLVREFRDTILSQHNIDLFEVPAPAIDTTGYAQTRGLLYILSAASVATTLSATQVIVSECGPTMYQPSFSPADQVTMTTHPFVVERAKELLGYLTADIEILLPFEDNTKAEVMSLCPIPKLFRRAHSCISQRLQVHDGTCYGCVIRRLAAIAASTPDTQYARDPLTDENAKNGNLLSLLDFCSDLLIDSNHLADHQVALIDQYNKWDLFKRFALDNFAAVYRLQRRVTLSPPVARIYKRVLRHFGDLSVFRTRLQTLKSLASSANKKA